MRKLIALILVSMVMPSFSGCFSEPEVEEVVLKNPFDDFQNEIPITTFYHFPNGTWINETEDMYFNGSLVLEGNNSPFFAEGTYYSVGYTTFEPTLGITSSGAIFFTHFNGLGEGTHIIRSTDQGQTWVDVGPFNQIDEDIGQTPNSNDPYIYVDKFNDKLVKFDMHALTAMFVEYSDNDGESWSIPFPVEGYYAPQDHQSIASMPHENAIVGDVVYVYCINTGSPALGAQCSRSLDGGHTWDVQRIGYPFGTPQCSGLHGHLAGGNDGAIYRGNPSCDGPAVYRSTDGGYTWSEHTITTEIGMQDGWHSHEVATAVDEANNVYAMWISEDHMPYVAYSRDHGDTWSEPWMVAPPNVTETGFPTIFAGEEGRVAFGYIGEEVDEGGWSGYMGIITDAFNEHPLITTVAVNQPDDALDEDDDCGDKRCGGFGDFIDIEIDDEGRPWIALAHNPAGEIGIVGTLIQGPTLYGDLKQLTPLMPGGRDTLP
ncbi:MAG: Uncharacterised protein [Methanobacteriota archaeon]|nr:MAG: Uncharacterised protein [Euryarchaeota archaeon]